MLSGRGVAVLGAREIEIGPGDFSAMPAPQEPLTMRNPFNLDLTHRSGGMSEPFDVVDLPAAGKPMLRMATRLEMVPLSALAPNGLDQARR